MNVSITIMNFTTKEKQSIDKSFYSKNALEIKMFIHNDPKEAEKAVSFWLNQNNINIHHITQSQCEKGGNLVFVLSLFYSKNESNN